ncbi:MAG: hypothetical protein D6812_04840 [Deltaproteobacteria bacterium]|nr:MAG: hypothetical protein D6812_04840 [Deltaproteobacteria bacterium]
MLASARRDACRMASRLGPRDAEGRLMERALEIARGVIELVGAASGDSPSWRRVGGDRLVRLPGGNL